MNPKNTFLLVVIAGVLFSFIFFVEPKLHQPKPGPLKVLPAAFNPDAITSVQVLLTHQFEIKVERTNGGWLLTKPLVYPAQSAAVENLLKAVTSLSPQTVISAQELKGRPAINEDYGFDNPQATLVFQQNGEQHTIKLGSFTAPGDEIYAQVVSGDRVDIIDATFFRNFVPKHFDDWRDRAFIHLSDGAFDQITIANGAQEFILQRAATNGVWHMEKPVRTRADYPKIDDLLLKLEQLRVTRFVTDNAAAGDLESYGLQPALLEIRLNQGTNQVLAACFGKSPTNDESHVYARCEGQDSIVLIPVQSVAAWQSGFQEFRDSHLARMSKGLPNEIDVNGQENFIVECGTNAGWRVTRPIAFPADTNKMREFIQCLANLKTVRFNDMMADDAVPDSEFPRYGLDAPSRKYILKRNAPPGGSNTIMAELDFGMEKEKKIFVRRADRPDETSVYAVDLVDFQKLPATSFQLRERRIWNFSEDQVANITVQQSGHGQKLVHKGPNQWRIADGSQGVINELQVEVGAEELGLLEAQNWVQRGDHDRQAYGFSDKSPSLSVELNGKKQPLILYFGKLSPLGLRYGEALMDDGQNWIFEFPKAVLDRLTAYFNIPESAFP